MLRLLSLFLLLATTSIPAYSQVFGQLANFDVVNDTGKTAHGFEIDIHDIHSSDITSIFGAADRWPNMERYGAPTVAEYTDATGFGVKITYQANYNGAWSSGTPSGTLRSAHLTVAGPTARPIMARSILATILVSVPRSVRPMSNIPGWSKLPEIQVH